MNRATHVLLTTALSAIVLAAAPVLAHAAEPADPAAAPAPVAASVDAVDPDASVDPAVSRGAEAEPSSAESDDSDFAAQAGEKSVPSAVDGTPAAAAADPVALTDPTAPVASDKPADASAAATTKDAATTKAAATPAAAPASAAKPDAAKAAAAAASTPATASDESYYSEDEVADLYRLYNPYSGEHFYTASAHERDILAEVGWNDEGLAWKVPTKRGDEVFRLYNPYAGDHHYTLSAEERDGLVVLGWRYEGVAWLSPRFGRLAVWRLYNPNAEVGTHHYTLSASEYRQVVAAGWNGEGVGFYGVDPDCVVGEPTDDLSHGVTSLAASFSAKDGSSARTVRSTAARDAIYLFLPSYADLASVTLAAFDAAGEKSALALSANGTDFDEVSPAEPVDLTALGAARSAEGGLAFLVKQGLEALDYIHNLVVMVSANVSTVFVDSNDPTQDRAYVEGSPDHSLKAPVAVNVVDKNGTAIYDKDELGNEEKLSSIKGRGNMTWGNGDKKPYQINLNKKADLLQSGVKDNANKKWILLANMNDPSLLRNTVAYDLALELGLVGMEGTFVDLYYDGEYRGTYYLCEKVEVKDGRVAIEDLEKALEKANPGVDLESLPTARAKNSLGYEYQYVVGVNNPDNVTGGYIVELDKTYYITQTCWFDTVIGHFSIKAPEVCSKECMEYISVAFQKAIDNLRAEVFNSEEGFSFDLDSYAKSYFVAEFLKNVDSYHSSTYFYIKKDEETIFSGPIWDIDGSAGIRMEDPIGLSHVAYEGFNLWNSGIFAKSVLMRERLTELFETTIAPLLSNVLLGDETAVGDNKYLHSIDASYRQVQASQRMNEVLFGLDGWDNILPAFSTYADNVAYLRNWIQWRLNWWTRNLDKLTGATEPAEEAYNKFPEAIYGEPGDPGYFDYTAVFDASYYLANCEDARRFAMGGDERRALEHFVRFGMGRGLQGSENFDVNAYRRRNPDLAVALGDDLVAYYKHYCEYGIYESRVAWA